MDIVYNFSANILLPTRLSQQCIFVYMCAVLVVYKVGLKMGLCLKSSVARSLVRSISWSSKVTSAFHINELQLWCLTDYVPGITQSYIFIHSLHVCFQDHSKQCEQKVCITPLHFEGSWHKWNNPYLGVLLSKNKALRGGKPLAPHS